MLSVKQVPKCFGKEHTLDRLGEEDDDVNEDTAVVGSVVVVVVT
jgi:hypothetical protein